MGIFGTVIAINLNLRKREKTVVEIWDAYDENLNLINNKTITRGDAIEDGVYHLVCEIAVQHIDGTYLLMKRDTRKHFGGMMELSAGGSALKGESPLECAVRELFEETGIVAKDIKEIGRVVQSENHSYYIEYICLTNADKGSVVLQEGETIDYEWVDYPLLLSKQDALASKRIVRFVTGK